MERVTATFDEATVRAIRRAAGKRGVSRFLQEAARQHLARLELLGLVDTLDAEHGRLSDDIRDAVDEDARRIFKR